jgi:hypothetical protein
MLYQVKMTNNQSKCCMPLNWMQMLRQFEMPKIRYKRRIRLKCPKFDVNAASVENALKLTQMQHQVKCLKMTQMLSQVKMTQKLTKNAAAGKNALTLMQMPCQVKMP